MDEESEVYTYSEYYLALKKNEILLYVTTQKNLKDITSSEISQTSQRTNTVWLHLHEVPNVDILWCQPKSQVLDAVLVVDEPSWWFFLSSYDALFSADRKVSSVPGVSASHHFLQQTIKSAKISSSKVESLEFCAIQLFHEVSFMLFLC